MNIGRKKSSPAESTPVRQDQSAAIAPRPSGLDGELAGLSLLLRIEELARRSADTLELSQIIANETRKFNRARQVFVIANERHGRARVLTVSGIGSVDPTSILAASVADMLANLAAERGLEQPVSFSLPAYCGDNSELASAYPFRELAWVPFRHRSGRVFGGMLLARESIWTENDNAITLRLGETYAHAWRELSPSPPYQAIREKLSHWRLAGIVAALAVLAVPVPVTTLAPAEIVARLPMLVTAPIDGVIDAIDVDPGAAVNSGDVLIRFVDTNLRNRRELAKREVAVAEARVKQMMLMSFADARGRHELGLAEAELQLKRSELIFTTETLDRSVVKATKSGLAVYSDRKGMLGRPVATGERLMEIADPAAIEIRIDVTAPDAIALKSDSDIKLFLDVDPLHAWQGRVVRSDYKARASDTDVLAFRTFATLENSDRAPPRIGLRGTAQVYGDKSPLAVYLLRRPLSAARQWLGL